MSRNNKFGSIQKLATRKTTSEEETALALSKDVFRGFIPANAIRTKKGFVGSKLDSLWARYIIDSFETDDGELADAALDSCLADISMTVEGGDFGSPFILGNYGFYAKSQFDNQASVLSENERQLAQKNGKYYLSEREWGYVDGKLGRFAKHGTERVQHATPGDTLLMLALREHAFEVGAVMIHRGVDPLVQNTKGEDMVHVVKEQYQVLAEDLRLILLRLESMAAATIIPTEMETAIKKDEKLVNKMNDLVVFLALLKETFDKRLKNIEQDKWTKRKYELRNQEVPYELRWNVAQEENVQNLVKDVVEMRKCAAERLERHQRSVADVNIRGVLESQKEHLYRSESKIDDDSLASAEAALRIVAPSVRTKVKKPEELENRLQITFTYDERGERKYDITALPTDSSAYKEPLFVKKCENSNESIMYR